jgi:hypothetical protein
MAGPSLVAYSDLSLPPFSLQADPSRDLAGLRQDAVSAVALFFAKLDSGG